MKWQGIDTVIYNICRHGKHLSQRGTSFTCSSTPNCTFKANVLRVRTIALGFTFIPSYNAKKSNYITQYHLFVESKIMRGAKLRPP